ncbi:9131_t:CDS:2, partial [Racocetra persica]
VDVRSSRSGYFYLGFENEYSSSYSIYNKGILLDTIDPKVHELSDEVRRTNDSSLDELVNVLNNTHHLPNSMKVDEFLTMSEKNLVYEIPLDDQIIKEFAYTFRRDKGAKNIDDEGIEIMDDERDDSIEIAIVSSSSAL